jgi:hypothetical protein
MTVEVLRSWDGGPLRQFSDDPQSGWSPYDNGPRKYAGSYVCENCGAKCVGVYFVSQNPPPGSAKSWICGPCKEKLRPKQAVPEGLRRDR